MAQLPSGTVTFLLTDIEGSTTRWERHPAAMRAALARHDALLHAGIAAHGGVVLTERGEGDSFFALFARATDAVAAACTLQRGLATEPWPEEVAPLRVRMALHTGEAGMREGADYRGAAVNRCARLRAVGHGGQVLLSGVSYELVRDSLPSEVGLRDLGAHRLKDLTRPEHIYQLLHPELPIDFPPLKTLDQRRHNLPVQPTALIGREREVQEVRERLLEPQTRLLTLTGVGGTGKTRLALQVAADVLESFADGTCFVNLAPISDPALVLPTIAQTLGIAETGSQPLREALHAFLHDKCLLLLLDNFEQVVDAAPVVAELLAACPQVRAVVTSRAALNLRGDRLYAVPPLALPGLTPLPPLERLTEYEAVRLFIARARDVRPAFAVTDENALAVAEICTQLDGLPLAIELAAVRVRLLPPQALLARLSNRLKLLAGGAHDLPARQQTLRATIDWSYSLLTAEEQTLFARLGVFVGGCALEDAEVICAPGGDLDVLEGVESLIGKSLLRQKEGLGSEARCAMLETIQEYARERLAASGAEEELRQQHAVYFLELAEAAEPELRGPELGAWLARLEAAYGNLRAALTWSIQTGAVEIGLRLAGTLWRFWLMRGYYSEGRGWLEEALLRSGKEPTPMRAKVLLGAGSLARAQGDYGRAQVLFEESLALYRRLEDKHGIASAVRNLAIVARENGDYGSARTLFEESLAIYREVGNKLGIASALMHLGYLAQLQGDHRPATMLLQEALAQHREQGDTRGTAISIDLLGKAAYSENDYARARALHEEALILVRELGDKGHIAYSLENMARLAGVQGQFHRAARLFGAAEALRTTIGVPLAAADRRAWDEPVLTCVRARLGEEAFATVWAAGQALSLEQAIAEALGEEAHA